MKRVSHQLLSLLILASIVLACKDETVPQPNWAYKFVGTFSFLQPAIYYQNPTNVANAYQIIACLRLEVIDNTHVQMNFSGNPFYIHLNGQYIENLFPPIDGVLNYEAINSYTLVSREAIRDNNGRIMVAIDTISAPENLRDSVNYRILHFKSKIREGLEFKSFQAIKIYNDASLRPLFWLIQQNKFSLNKLVGGFLYKGAEYECDFGDGTVVATRNVEHEYKKNGTYTITVKITNELGQKVSESFAFKVGNL